MLPSQILDYALRRKKAVFLSTTALTRLLLLLLPSEKKIWAQQGDKPIAGCPIR